MIEIGSVLENRYRIEKELGKGGNSIVYEAVHLRTERHLAVKEIPRLGGYVYTDEQLQIIKDLHHPGIPMILDILETDLSYLIIMEYVAGVTLQQEMEKRQKDNRKFSLEEIQRIGTDLCEILSYLHTLPIPVAYRDIKPSNIVIRPSGRIALVDLDSLWIAGRKSIENSPPVGSLGYAAPEQYRSGADHTPGTEIYSVGALLHQILTGHNPAQTPFSFVRITRADPELLSLYQSKQQTLLGFERIIEKCTAFHKKDRYQTVDELMQDLECPSACYSLKGRRRRKALFRLFLPCVFLALAIGAGLLSLQSGFLIKRIKEEGKTYCLMKAQRTEEKQMMEWIQAALRFSPGDASCFNVMLDRMLTDGVLSREEQIQIRELLDQRVEGEVFDHETLLRKNPEDCFRFAYRMGTACLYASEGIPDYSAAGNWFQDVLDSGDMWKPENSGIEKEKQLLIKRTLILVKICDYRRAVLEGAIQMDQNVSLLTYWEELTDLLETDLPAGNLLAVELGLWREILGLLTDWPTELNMTGISWEEQEAVLEKILLGSSLLQESVEAGEYPSVKEQLLQIENTGKTVKEKRELLEEAERQKKKEKQYGE